MRIEATNLDPELVTRLQRFGELLEQHRLRMRITEGYRTPQRQNELFARGRTAPGPRVTNARAGESPHNHRMAVDLCFPTGDPYAGHDADWQLAGPRPGGSSSRCSLSPAAAAGVAGQALAAGDDGGSE